MPQASFRRQPPTAVRRPTVARAAQQRQSKLRNGKEARAAADLEARLDSLRAEYFEYPPLREALMGAIAAVHAVAVRDRKSDRDAVFRAIFDHSCREVCEIVEDTRLTRWIVQGVLDELVMNDLVEIREKFYLEGRPEGEETLEYHPVHTRP